MEFVHNGASPCGSGWDGACNWQLQNPPKTDILMIHTIHRCRPARRREILRRKGTMLMFKYGVACSLNDVSTTAPIILRGPIEQLCQQAKEIGYDGLEIQLANPMQYDWGHIKKVCGDYGLELITFATGRELGENGLCLLSDDEAVRRAAVARLKEHIDCAQAAGCQVIVGSMRKHVPDWSQSDRYLGYHRDAIIELADYAKDKGVRIWVENILSFISNFLNTMRQVQDFVVSLPCDNVGVHLDTYSMNMEDNDIPASYRYCAPNLEYVHFSDTARLYPGGGNVDFKTHMRCLKEIGYQGFITTECVPIPTAYDCADLGLKYMKAMEQIVEIEMGASRFA